MNDFDPDGPGQDGALYGLTHSFEEARVVVLPVPFEPTTSYRQGTAHGPAAVLAASTQVDLCDLETGEAWRQGIAMADEDPRIAALNAAACADARLARDGDDDALQRVEEAGATLNGIVEAWTEARLDAGQIPAILGGDHSVPLGAMRAAARAHPGIGILHVDAHADLRVAYEGFEFSHASILHNVLQHEVGPVVQVGLRDVGYAEVARIKADKRLHAWSDLRIAQAVGGGTSFAELVQQMLEPLPEEVWVTFDIDGLDPALCPNTGTPVPGGLSWREALLLLGALGRSGRRIVGFDLCEVGAGEWDANVGARLLYKLAGWAIVSSGKETP